MEQDDYFAKIFYHFYNRYYNLMLVACKDAIVKFPSSLFCKLYHSLALMLTSRLEEGVHDLEAISQEQDVKLSATIALMYGHKYLGVANKEIYVKLDMQMKEYRKNAEAVDFYNSAFVLMALNKVEKALDYVEKAISMNGQESKFFALKGWIFLMLKSLGRSNVTSTKTIFNEALRCNPRDLLGILGMGECCLYLGEHGEALNLTNKALVQFSESNLPLLLKIKVHLASQDWEEMSEAMTRFNVNEGEIIYCQNYEILINLCYKNDLEAACSSIKRLSELLWKFEPHNILVTLQTSKLYAKLCNKNKRVLKETIAMLEVSLQSHADDTELIVELGNQYALLGNTKEASKLFKSATKMDEGCFGAFLGLSLCEYLDNGLSQQLHRQIQYLLELKDASSSLTLHLLQARLADTSTETLKHLKLIYDVKTELLKLSYYSDKYLLALDPSFTLEVVQEYLQHSSASGKVMENAFELISLVVKACPSLPEALFLQAKLQYLKKENNQALVILDRLFKLPGADSSEAYLLTAQIELQNGQYDLAAQNLESCTSSNFKIRDNPLYHYVSALIDKNSGNHAKAVKSLNTALDLISSSNKVSLADKASMYVELIDTLNMTGQTEEALKALEEANNDLQDTPEEYRILLLSADNMIKRKNVQGAIDLLEKIGREQSCYREARVKMAEIYLKYRRDRAAYLKVYEDIVQENPTSSESYVLLGDAYMRVLEPDLGLENYEKAIKNNPSDMGLTIKMGKALVEAHYFNRAVGYYKKAIKEARNPDLILQLGELYLNIRDYEKGELLLLDEIEEDARRENDNDDLPSFSYRAKLRLLLAQIQEKSGNFTYAIKSLKESMGYYVKVKKRMTVDQTGTTDDVDRQLVDTSLKLGEMAVSMKNKDQAVSYYKEGLVISPNNVLILVALAKLYMQMNHLELCQQTCNAILRIQPDNEAASVMMADIAFRKVDFDMALFHFNQIVSKQPTNWDALTRLIEVSMRLGQIQECEQYINKAEEDCVNPAKEPGFLYCKAYYQWHSGNLNAALKNFNQVRQDPDYGVRALYHMIDICLNPDGEMLAEQLMDSDDIEYRDSRVLALRTAERLIKELKQRVESNSDDLLKCRLLTNFRLLATKEKPNIDQALEDFVAIASLTPSKENLGAILGMATAYTLTKQQQRAKNQLKRVVKTQWNFEDAQYLEKCWLLLADQYLQSNKYESAGELISKVVQHNKACTKAYEYLGYIGEKEHRFKDAVNNYQQAWSVGLKSNANVGFKLAYCLLKCKKYPVAIDVANEVLKLNPDYYMVKKEILDKCIGNLRV